MSIHINKKHKESLSLGEKIAKFITERVGTMACATIFAVLAFISLPSVIASGQALVIVAWLAQTFLQLVLLPIIMVGQTLQSRHSELLAEATYENDIEMSKHVEIIKSDVKKLLKKKK
jgi:hypothetical protein